MLYVISTLMRLFQIVPFYTSALDLLRSSPLESVLETFSDLLSSAFVRDPLPSPLPGPLAFMNFCNAVTPKINGGSNLGNLIPVKLKVYTREMAAISGIAVPEWMGSETQVGIQS